MDKTDVPAEYKSELENELLRNILSAPSDSGVKTSDILCSPEKLAEELTKKFKREYPAVSCPPPPKPPRRGYGGDLMVEHSDVNLKLLYIPLLQISSGTQRMTMPLTDD